MRHLEPLATRGRDSPARACQMSGFSLGAVALPLLLFLVATAISLSVSGVVPQPVHDDAWFNGDSSWVHWNVTTFRSYHRTRKHPLFSMVVLPAVKALSMLGLSTLYVVRLVFSVIAGLWALLFYAVLNQSLGRRGDSALFTLLGLASSAFLFWCWISETFLLSSVTILLAMLAFHASGRPGILQHGIAAVATLAVTVTNWHAALLAAAMRLPRRGRYLPALAGGSRRRRLDASPHRPNFWFFPRFQRASKQGERLFGKWRRHGQVAHVLRGQHGLAGGRSRNGASRRQDPPNAFRASSSWRLALVGYCGSLARFAGDRLVRYDPRT